jgi:hypothetical protein
MHTTTATEPQAFEVRALDLLAKFVYYMLPECTDSF